MSEKTNRPIWAPQADQDLLDIWDYYTSEASEDIADIIVERIVVAAHRVHRLPMSGRPRDDLKPGLRAVLAQPYILFYRVAEAGAEVIRVLHERRDIAEEFAKSD